jgi:hypothetical protein
MTKNAKEDNAFKVFGVSSKFPQSMVTQEKQIFPMNWIAFSS